MPTSCPSENASQRSLGERLLSELSKRGQRGMYFDFAAYQEVRHVDTTQALQKFLDKQGFTSVLAKDDPVWIADGLEEAANYDATPAWAASTELGLLWLPFFFWKLLNKKRRVFPKQQKNAKRYRVNQPA